MKKTIIFTAALLCTGLVIAYCVGLYPILIFNKTKDLPSNLNPIQNENKPFQHFDFQNGRYTAYVVISINDLMSSWSGVPRNRVLKSSDKQILNQLKTCEFISNGNDSLNIESHLYIVRNDSLVYKSELVLDSDYEGIHSDGGGWAESRQKGQLLRIFRQFEKETNPIVFLK